jgi:rubredoxin
MNETAAPATIKCGYCGEVFAEDRGQAACRACPLTRACRYLRCPSCGYENPVAPAWLSGLWRWVGADGQR